MRRRLGGAPLAPSCSKFWRSSLSRHVPFDARRASLIVLSCALGACALGAGAPRIAHAEPPEAGAPQVQPPVVLEESRPPYPPEAEGAKGEVAVTATISAAGEVTAVELQTGVAPALNRAALKAAMSWRFRPALRNATPIASRVQLLFHFEPPAAPPQIAPLPVVAPLPAPSPSRASGSRPSAATGPGHARRERARAPSAAEPRRLRLPHPRRRARGGPTRNASELLKLAPGILLTNEGGEGHAEQVFLRGFDAREGQDIEFTVGGVPINEAATCTATATPTRTSSSPSWSSRCAWSRGRSIRARATTRSPAAPTTSSASRSAASPPSTRPAASARSASCHCGGRRARARTRSPAPRSTRPTASARTATRSAARRWASTRGSFGETGLLPAHRAGLRDALPLRGRHPRGRLRRPGRSASTTATISRAFAQPARARGRRRLALLDRRRPRDARGRHDAHAAGLRHQARHAPARELHRLPPRRAGAAAERTGSAATCRPERPRAHDRRARRRALSRRLPSGSRRSSSSATSRAATRRPGRSSASRPRPAFPTRPTPISTRSSATSALYARRQPAPARVARAPRRRARRPLHLRRARQLRGADGRAPVDDEPADRPELPHAAGLRPPARARPGDRRPRAPRSCRAPRARGPVPAASRSSASYGQGVRSIDPSYITQDVETPFASVVAYEAGVAYAGNLREHGRGRPLDRLPDASSTRTSSSSETAGRNVLGVGHARAPAGSARCASTGAFFDESANLTLVRAPTTTPHRWSPTSRHRLALGHGALRDAALDRFAESRSRGALGAGITYVGPRPLPYGQVSERHLHDRRLGHARLVALRARARRDQPARHAVPARRVQLRVRLPQPAAADAGPRARRSRPARRAASSGPSPSTSEARDARARSSLVVGSLLVCRRRRASGRPAATAVDVSRRGGRSRGRGRRAAARRSRPSAAGDVVAHAGARSTSARSTSNQTRAGLGRAGDRLHPARRPTSPRSRRRRSTSICCRRARSRFPRRGTAITDPPAADRPGLAHRRRHQRRAPTATPILDVAGTATRAAARRSRSRARSRSARTAQTAGAAAAGGDPICKQRIVSPIPTVARRRDDRRPRSCGSTRAQLFVERRLRSCSRQRRQRLSPSATTRRRPATSQPSQNLYPNLHVDGALHVRVGRRSLTTTTEKHAQRRWNHGRSSAVAVAAIASPGLDALLEQQRRQRPARPAPTQPTAASACDGGRRRGSRSRPSRRPPIRAGRHPVRRLGRGARADGLPVPAGERRRSRLRRRLGRALHAPARHRRQDQALERTPTSSPGISRRPGALVAEVDGPWAVDLAHSDPSYLPGKGGPGEEAVPIAALVEPEPSERQRAGVRRRTARATRSASTSSPRDATAR